MIVDNLIMLREKAGNPSFKIMAEKSGVSVLTISRIYNRKIDFPSTHSLSRLAIALNCTLPQILAGTDTAIGNVDELEAKIQTLTDEVSRLTAEVEKLNMEASYKDEIIRLKDEIITLLSASSEKL